MVKISKTVTESLSLRPQMTFLDSILNVRGFGGQTSFMVLTRQNITVKKCLRKKLNLIEIEYDLRTWAAAPGQCGHISKLDLNNCDLIEFTSA